MVSMKDIARKCNVSVATVSKALNGHSDIGEATKQKVVNTAREMGYFPNSSARALKTRRTYNLGVLFVDAARNGLRQDYFSALLDSFKVTAEGRGYDITFINSNKGGSGGVMSYLEHSRYRGVDGVAIACVDFTDPEVIELMESDMPVVTIDYEYSGVPSVVSDNTKGIEELTEYICKKGHRDIVYITGDNNHVTALRRKGFEHVMEKNGIDVSRECIRNGAYRDVNVTERITRELLLGEKKPTCIIYPDDYAAFGGINALQELGLSAPKDISIAGYDGIDMVKKIAPQLTTIEQDTFTIGKLAAQKLIGLIEDPENTKIDCTKVAAKLLEGKTVATV